MTEPIVIQAFAGPGGPPDSCWDGLGFDNGNGYRFVKVDDTKRYVHRLSYEHFTGPLGDLYVDHLCRNRACWNPAHLEAVTNEENILRGESAPAKNARKTACPQCGSEYIRDGKYRRCRPCKQRRRKDTKRLGVGRPADRTHCPRDHPFDETNTRIVYRPDGTVKQRVCIACKRQQLRDARARKAGKSA